MDINLEKNTITLYGKSTKYDLLLKKLANLPGDDLYQFISNRGIALPRKMNCMAMVSVLNEKIKYLHSNSLSREYFQRLQYYKDFGETQLTELFKELCNDDDYYQYRYNLYNLILTNYEALELNDGEIQYLKNIRKSGLESFVDYSTFVSACSLEQKGTFDGIELDLLKNNLLLSATISDIVTLANKYGIEIPEHLSKDQYYEFILYYLRKNESLTEELENELSNMTLAGLTAFSRRNGIPLQPSLNKEDYVTYLFYYLDDCEITTTSVTEIKATDNYYPIDFKFDLSQINIFGEDIAKRIVKFDGDDNQEYVDKINQIIEEANKVEEPEFIKFEESESVLKPLRPGEKTMDDDDGEIELEDYEKEEIQEENQNEENVSLEDDTFDPALLEEEKEEPKEEEVIVEKIDITNVIKNDEYASKRLKDLKNGNRKIVLLSISTTIAVLLLAFVIWALVR